MKENAIVVVTSLLSILLLTLHITDDIVRGISKAESSNLDRQVLCVGRRGRLPRLRHYETLRASSVPASFSLVVAAA